MYKPILSLIACAAALLTATTSTAQVTPGGTFTDKAIFTEAGGTEILDRATTADGVGTTLTHDFDTTVTADGSYELSAPSTIALSSGRHLVIYSTRFDAGAGSNRAEIQTNLTLAGSAIAAGRSQGFIRRLGGADETVMSGGAIIDVDGDNDLLTLESRRSDNNPSVGVLPAREPGATSIQLLKLDDNWDFLSLELGASVGAVNTTPSSVTYDTNNSPTTMGTAFAFAGTGSDVTLNEAGLYLVFANTGIANAAANVRTNYGQRLTLDGVAVDGSATSTYVRGNANGENARNGVASVGMIVSATAGQVLNVEVVREPTGSAGTVQGGETALTIVKLPLTAKYIELTDTSNQDILDPAVDVVSFDTQTTASNGQFTHSGGSTVTVNESTDYLFFSSLFTTGDVTNDNHDRVVPVHGWQIDGAGGPIDRGLGAAYNRDNGNNRNSGSWSATLLELTSGQTVEMTTQNIGTPPGTPVLANTPVLQALNIASLIVSNDPSVLVNAPITLEPNTSATITDGFLDTFDNDTAAAGLTYTVDSAPALGTLLNNGSAIGLGGTFTQADVDSGLVTFNAGGVDGLGGFDFTVSDGTGSDTGAFVFNVQFPITNVSIESDGDVSEGGDTDFIVTVDVAPVGADLTVNLVYSGAATDGADFTGIASINIPAGQTSAAVNIVTLSDGLFEGDESVTASIGTMSGATVTPMVGSPSSATFIIRDAGNNAPTATNLSQVLGGAGTVAIGDIVVTDADATYDSSVVTAASPLFQTNGIANRTVYSDGRADAGSAHDVDATGSALDEASGMSVEINFIPRAADLVGVVDLWEIGGSSNGSSVLLIDGVPHLLSKTNGVATDAPTDDGTLVGAFTDADWAGDNTILIPLNGANSLVADLPSQIAVVYDISADTVKSSVNGSAEISTTLLNRDGTNWRGDHTSASGSNAGTSTGGSNSGSGVAGVLPAGSLKNMAAGASAVSSVRFWNEATGSATGTAGVLDVVTATLTIDAWTATSGSLTTTSGNGETFSAGVWTVTGDVTAVNAALAAVEFVTDVGTLDPTIVQISIEDGDEDGGGPTTGAIAIAAAIPDPIYVDGSFSGSLGDLIADADGGSAVAPARFGISAFQTLAEALTAVQPTGTIIVNDGDYTTENITLTDSVTFTVTDSAGPVQIGHLISGTNNSIEILGSNTLEVGALNLTSGAVDSSISGSGNFTKVGTGLFVIRETNPFTGTTTVDAGTLRIGFLTAAGIQGELTGDGPVVINAGARLEFNVAVDLTIAQTGVISGAGEVATMGAGTLIFDGPANTFTGGFELGAGTSSTFDGVDQGVKGSFVVVNDNGHLGTGAVLSRGGQLQAGTAGVVVPNDINVTAGGFRCGGLVDYELSGTITTIDFALRGFGNYGLDGTDLTISGNIVTSTSSPANLEGSNGRDNGGWIVSADISGPEPFGVAGTFDAGEVVFSGNITTAGAMNLFSLGTAVVFDATQTGGTSIGVNDDVVLSGSGSTTSPVTIGAAATLSPDGTFTTGGLTVAGTLAADLGSDLVVSAGPVDVTTGTFIAGVSPSPAVGVYTVIQNDDAGAITGEFAGFAEGAAVDSATLGWSGSATYLQGGNDFAINYSSIGVFAQWRLDNYGSSANSGPGADLAVASNGLTNLENFGLGLDPNAAAPSLEVTGGVITRLGQPTIYVDPATGRIYLQHTRRADFASIPIEVTEEFSRNPNLTFEPSPLAGTVIATGTGAGGVAIEAVQTEFPAILPISGRPGRYGRVVITIP